MRFDLSTRLTVMTFLGMAVAWAIYGALAEDSAPVTIPAKNVNVLRENLGQEVTVTGLIERTGKSRSGHQFLNFAYSELTAVCFRDAVERFRGGAPAEIYDQKHVELTGKVELYQGKVQIRLENPSQIRIIEPPPQKTVPGIKLKQLDARTWLSPQGLRYTGFDPEGLTRLEHILRHTKDQPNRDGPHGVFDGGGDVAFAVIDEAWALAQKRKLRPVREGDRSSYTISMGRRIGFLGGKTGASRRHPPLQRIFIVFETDTKNVITAFPK